MKRAPSPSPTLLVLAAGLGSRYGGLKQLDPVGPSGETIVEYSVYDALRAGFSKAVFVIRQEMEPLFRERFGAKLEGHIEVDYVFQELDRLPTGFSVPEGRMKPWGTAHAILVAADTIHEPFAIINADDFYGAQGYRALALHLQSATSDPAMVGYVLRNTLSDFGAVSRGVCQLSADDYLIGVTERTRLERDGLYAKQTEAMGTTTRFTGEEWVSMNLWGFTPQVFDWLHIYFERFLQHSGSDRNAECFLPSMMNELVVDGRAQVKVLRSQDAWFGITYREDLPRVVARIGRLIEEGHYPERLW